MEDDASETCQLFQVENAKLLLTNHSIVGLLLLLLCRGACYIQPLPPKNNSHVDIFQSK